MQRNRRYDADLFLRARWAAMFARKIAAAELLGEIDPPQSSACQSETEPASPLASLPSLGELTSLVLGPVRSSDKVRGTGPSFGEGA